MQLGHLPYAFITSSLPQALLRRTWDIAHGWHRRGSLAWAGMIGSRVTLWCNEIGDSS